MSLESFRPFSAPQVLGTTRIPVLTIKAPKNSAILTWGSAGHIVAPTKDNAPKISPGLAFKVNPTDSKWVEIGRKVQPVKVVNPKDPSQYVVVAATQGLTKGQSAAGQPGSDVVDEYPDRTASTTPPGFMSGPNAGLPAAVTPTAPSNSYETYNPNVMAQVNAATEAYYANLDDAPPGPIGPVLDVNNVGAVSTSTAP